MQKSFGMLELEQRVRRNGALMKVEALINWESLRPLLKGLYRRDHTNRGGQEPFDCLLMFKALLLGQWHSLSDEKLEQALLVRIDFMQFCGLNLTDDVPDETTLCRFRNRLIRAELLGKLLAQINTQLQAHGLMVAKATGAVVDATLIQSAARPNKTITVQTDEAGQETVYEDGSRPGVIYEEKNSADPDATWVKKGKKSYFGYRSYWVVDSTDGYVHGVHTAPANESEMKHFQTALESAPLLADRIGANRVYADKGFSSQAHRDFLRSQKIKVAIQHRAVKNKPLTPRQKLANRLISKKRYIVEQAFGTAKRLLNMQRTSYFSTVKVHAQMVMKALCLNLIKATHKILEIHPCMGVVRPQQG